MELVLELDKRLQNIIGWQLVNMWRWFEREIKGVKVHTVWTEAQQAFFVKLNTDIVHNIVHNI